MYEDQDVVKHLVSFDKKTWNVRVEEGPRGRAVKEIAKHHRDCAAAHWLLVLDLDLFGNAVSNK